MKARSLRPLFAAATLLCVYLTTEAAEGVPPSALALADAMQVVETTRLAIETRTQAGIENGNKSPKELACWKAADFAPVRSVYAEAFARVLTVAEMDEATAFLATSLGKKFVQHMNAEGSKAGGRAKPWAASLTDEENVAVMGFLATSAGSKIYSDAWHSSELKKQMIDSLLPVLQKCMEFKSTDRYFAELDASMTASERQRAVASAGDTARPSESDAVKLVRAMREDEFFLAQLHQRMKKETRPIPQVRTACLDSLKPADISDAMAVSIQEQLSATEVRDAIDYYESEAGRKYTKIVFDNLESPVELPDFLEVMSVDEMQRLRQFFMLPVSRKLMQDKIIQQPDSMNRVSQRLREVMVSCVRKNGVER